MKNSSDVYNKDYYENGIQTGRSLYQNYRWIPELTLPLCFTIIEKFKIKEEETILDFGCSKGYLVKGFRLLHRIAFGADISSYAIGQSPEDVREYLYCVNSPQDIPLQNQTRYTYVIAKDVLEHVSYEEIEEVLKGLRKIGERLFIIVPLAGEKTQKYIIPAMELDVTHKIRESRTWWETLFLQSGFSLEFSSYAIPHMKENWAHYPTGHGFFLLNSL